MSNTITHEQGNFSTIPNQLLNDSMISLTAKGLYVFMRGKPPLWNFTIRSMAKQLKEGETAIGNALNELKDSGWISYTKHSDGKGVYHLHWSTNPEHENPNQENPNQGFTKKGKPQRISKKEPVVRNNDSKQEAQQAAPHTPKKQTAHKLIAANEFEQELINYRKEIKKPLKTQRGLTTLVNAIANTAKAWNTTERIVADFMMGNEWQSISPSYNNPFANQQNAVRQSPTALAPKTNYLPAAENQREDNSDLISGLKNILEEQ